MRPVLQWSLSTPQHVYACCQSRQRGSLISLLIKNAPPKYTPAHAWMQIIPAVGACSEQGVC